MQDIAVSLHGAREIQSFVNTLLPLEGDFEFISDRHILDARSLMGIFSLDTSKPLTLRVHKDAPETINAIREFIAHEPEVTK